jgi:hypothetical protein
MKPVHIARGGDPVYALPSAISRVYYIWPWHEARIHIARGDDPGMFCPAGHTTYVPCAIYDERLWYLHNISSAFLVTFDQLGFNTIARRHLVICTSTTCS